MPEFKRSLAVVIGINQYVNGIPELKTAVNDANQLALILEENYQYQVLRLLDREATQDKLTSLLAAFEEQTLPLPDGSKIHVEPDDQFLFYFAGHGFAQDGLDNADGAAGFLVPQDGQRDDSTWLPMQQLHDALVKLPCRHLLIILDCCFAGTFRWAGLTREMVRSQKVYRERYDRFIAGCAQQVITSAAHDEKAADSLYRFGQRGDHQGHSPFAEALFLALSGEADFTNDGVMTATELYLYLHDKITTKQTPQICQLKRHDKGEYIFPIRGFDRNELEEAPKLDEKTNPYKGLASFEEEDSDKFFGRTALIQKLQEFVTTHPLTVVLGASGTGKSSLVKAGLIPQLKKSQQEWRILAPIRLGESPFRALNNTLVKENLPVVDQKAPEPGVKTLLARLANWSKLNPNSKLLLVIDQCEELVTLCRNDTEREKFLLGLALAIAACPEQLRLVLTVRNDFEPQLSDTALKPYWTSARFVVPGMTREQLREAIVEPATARVMYFEPPTLVDELIDEVMQMPGALPLLSFTLSELYFKYIQSVREGIRSDRAIQKADYEELGGVTRSLTQRADFEYEQLVKLDPAYEQIIKYVMLRMVAVDGGELARRKVLLSELEYPPTQNQRVQEVIQQFTDARLLVKGQDSEGNCYVEPAHDALVRGWQKLLVWKQQEQESLILQRRLTPAAMEWNSHQPKAFHWSADPRDWWKQFWDRQQQAKFLWHTNPRLDFLKQVLDSTDNWFNQVEAEFVRQSVRQRRKNTTRRWSLVTVALVMLSAATVIAIINAINAQNKLIQATSALSESLFASNQKLDALKEAIRAKRKLQALGRIDADLQLQVESVLCRAVYGAVEFNRLEGHNGEVRSAVFSPDGSLLASTSSDKTIKLWKRDGTLLKTLEGHRAGVSDVAFSPDGQTLASASEDKTIKLWKRDGTLLKTLEGHRAGVNKVAFSPDGNIFASASDDRTVKLWRISGTPVLLTTLKEHQEAVKAVAFSRDGNMIVSASADKTIKIWKRDGTFLSTIAGHNTIVWDIAISPDGNTIASASGDNTVKLWNKDGKLLKTLEGHQDAVSGVAFSPDGKMIASASWDNTVKVWNKQGILLTTLNGHSDRVWKVTFSPDSKILASVSGDSTIRFWKRDSAVLTTLQGHSKSVIGVAISPIGKMVASASDDGTVKLWTQDSTLPVTLDHKPAVLGVAISPDSSMIASAGSDSIIKLWNKDGTLLNTLQGHKAGIWGVAFSPDGNTIASSGWDKTMKLWNKNGSLLRTLEGHQEPIWDVAFSPDGNTIASASGDTIVKLWNKNGTLLNTLQGHKAGIWGVAFSADGNTIATASEDKTVKLWKRDGTLLTTLEGHQSIVFGVAFSPDGKTLASASADKTVKLWNVKTGKLPVLPKSWV